MRQFKKNKKKSGVDLLLLLYLLFVLPESAYAYIDPGSIAMLLQVIFAALAGVLLAFRESLLNFFRSRFGRRNKNHGGDHKENENHKTCP